MENNSTTEKADLRRQFRQIRMSIDPNQRRQMDQDITASVKVLPEVKAAKVLFVYLSRNGEASTAALVHELLEGGKTVLTPSPDIRALPHDGLFRVHLEEPGRHTDPYLCTESRIEDVDLVVVPGIVWDKEGYRVGFGGGYFDRLLSMTKSECVKVGLCYSCQLLPKVPREHWDEPVDILVTEDEVIRTRSS